MTPAKISLAMAEKNLAQAEIVRIAAIKAVELAQEAVKFEAAGVAAALITTAAEEAAKAIRNTEMAALHAWQDTVAQSLERSISQRNRGIMSDF